MANDVNTTVTRRSSCTRNHRTDKRQRKLRIFPPPGLIEFVAIDLLHFLPKTRWGNKYIVVIKDPYFKLTKATATAKTTATRTVNILMEHWVADLGIPSKVLTKNGPQFTSKFFAALCKQLNVKTVTKTEYHLQAGRHVKRFNATMISSLSEYVAEHENDGDTFLFPLTYVYSVLVHRTTKLALFSLAIIFLPPGSTAIARSVTPDVSKIDSPLTCSIRLIYRAGPLSMMADKKFKKAYAR